MVLFSGAPALSIAHEGMKHGGEKMAGTTARQHRLMADYAETRAEIGKALEKGNAASVEAGSMG